MSEKESKDILKGTTLEIYRLLLNSNKPLGIREIQRALNLSSARDLVLIRQAKEI